MGAFKNAVSALVKRPKVLLAFGLTTLIFWIAASPLVSVLIGLGTLGDGNVVWSVVSLLQLLLNFILDPKVLVVIVLGTAGFLLAASAVIGFVLAGSLNSLNNAMEGKPKFKGDFMFGVKKFFFRIFLVTLRSLFFGLLFVLAMLVVSIPAIVITRAALSGKPEFLPVSILLNIVTAAVIFFSFLFFRIYFFFWVPAAGMHDRKAFSIGKQTADRSFWRLAGALTAFDLFFLTAQLLLMRWNGLNAAKSGATALQDAAAGVNSPHMLLGVVLQWAFLSLFFSLLTAYIFSSFQLLHIDSQR